LMFRAGDAVDVSWLSLHWFEKSQLKEVIKE